MFRIPYYGIHHVKHPEGTPLLLVLGHSKGGAITAATKGSEEIDRLEESIQRELKPLLPGLIHKDVSDPTDQQVMENVIANVHYQVGQACLKYRDQIERQELWVVGAVYDFTLEGKGQIKIIQVNHQTDPGFINEFKAAVLENGNYCRDPGREHPCQSFKK